MKKIIWLASYPKSGNTWMRALLSNYLSDRDDPKDINDLQTDGISSARSILDEILEVNSTEIDRKIIDHYRPVIFQTMAARAEKDRLLIKTHETYHLNHDGQPIFPADESKAAIYIIRDPRDVAVSYSHHIGRSIVETINILNNNLKQRTPNNLAYDEQIPQKLSSWSDHYRSWSEQNEIPHIVIRYEDMHLDTLKVLKRVCEISDIEWEQEKAIKAIAYSTFENLRTQESQKGFNERSKFNKTFFRNGKTGSWKQVLNTEEARSIEETHKEVMDVFGYE